MRTFPILLLIAFLTSVFGMSGCTQPLNDRITLGGRFSSPTFETHENTLTVQHDPTQLLSTIPKPRTSWKTTQYITPVDGVVHRFELTIPLNPHRDNLPRMYGMYPSADDAISFQTTPWMTDAFCACADLGRSFIGTPYAIGYLAITGKIASPMTSPHENWKRQASNPWSSGSPAATKSKPVTTSHEITPNDQ